MNVPDNLSNSERTLHRRTDRRREDIVGYDQSLSLSFLSECHKTVILSSFVRNLCSSLFKDLFHLLE